MNQVLASETTVGVIAARQPAAARVFEKYQIDYCCGGDTPLPAACRARGLEPGTILAEIAAEASVSPEDRFNWTSASATALIEHIVSAHHAYLRVNLPRIGMLFQKVLAAHGDRHGDTLRPLADTFGMLADEIESHLVKEERVLFPWVQRLDAGQNPASHCGGLGGPLSVMLSEHDSAGAALRRMRELTGNYQLPADTCNTYRELYQALEELEHDLHRHIHLENNILFPKAVELEGGTA